MEPEDVATLLFRVGFEGLVAGGRCDVSDLAAFVRHPSSALRAAWIVTVDRMLHADDDLIAVSSP